MRIDDEFRQRLADEHCATPPPSIPCDVCGAPACMPDFDHGGNLCFRCWGARVDRKAEILAERRGHDRCR